MLLQFQPQHLNSLLKQGTAPFMSVEVMRDEELVSHRLKHNLKSFFYILLYICMKYKAPSTKRVQEDLKHFRSFPIDDWFTYD